MFNKLSNKELVSVTHDLAKTLGADTPLLDIAKLLAESATRLDVAIARGNELQRKVEDTEALMLAMRDDSRESRSKLELVTAECAALVNYIDGECYTESKRTGVYTCAGINKPASPATDAMVNEIRAEGVELAINYLMNKFEGTGHIGVPVMALESLANQLRADAAKDGE
ncbi:hypothetical protein PRCB_16390 [Pantoea rodasii]|uniref:Uncharacterized protein n=1 Tax=Pantoea rodasii TaxID=1076549 RepID=A0A2M9WBR4_9GAMM|nr:hypothetical protein [Pantoea rodasii]ORM64511.1 hypothetical protein HA45_09060 [Pantoea rodasii]PJZ04981.1 hypothetical protein PRCB_16390 [Pantoea rodasii]